MYFSKMKEKRQKAYRIESYDEVLINTLLSMFIAKGYPEELDKRQCMVESSLLRNGAAAIFKLTESMASTGNDSYVGKYIVTDANLCGAPDVYGIGQDCICTTGSGVSVTFEDWRNNPDIVVIFNNSCYSPDLNVGRYSDALAELEVSLKLNVLFARMYPIPVCADNKAKQAIEDALKSAMDGKIATILSPDAIAKYVAGDTTTGVDLVNITDVEKSQYIQYLAKYRDDLMRWFYSLYGMNSQGSSKMAQQTVDEVNQDNNASMIIPHDMLRMRQQGAEELNEKFGWNVEYSFSECWQSRLANMDDEFKETDEELEAGEAEEATEEPGEEESNEQ